MRFRERGRDTPLASRLDGGATDLIIHRQIRTGRGVQGKS
jgi:hypothetical protein